jgi:hypothetical protein
MAAAGGTGPRERTPTGTFSADASTFNEDSAQHRRLQNQCKKVEKDNEALNKQMRELKEKHKDELADVERITAEKAVAEAQVQTLKDEMAELVRAQARPRGVARRAATDSERTRDRHGAVFDQINNKAFKPQAKADAIEWFLQRNPDILEGILCNSLQPDGAQNCPLLDRLQDRRPESFDGVCRRILLSLEENWSPQLTAQLQCNLGLGNNEKWQRFLNLQSRKWDPGSESHVPRLVQGRYKPPSWPSRNRMKNIFKAIGQSGVPVHQSDTGDAAWKDPEAAITGEIAVQLCNSALRPNLDEGDAADFNARVFVHGDAAGMMRGVKTSKHDFKLVQTTNAGLECSPFLEVALVNNEGPDNYAGLKPHYDRINPVIKKLRKEGLNIDGSRVNVDFFQGGDLPFQAAVNGRCGHSGESFCDLCLDKLVDIQDLGRHEDGSCFMKP